MARKGIKMKFRIYLVFFIISSLSWLANASLEGPLKERIKSCHSLFDGEQPPKFVMDPKNGYAHVSGGYPTCGCPCSATAAYFNSKKGQVWLSYETEGCNYDNKFSSNKDLWTVLPKNISESFGLNTEKKEKPHFYLEPTIPQNGTNTVVEIKPIPIGINMDCKSNICLEIGSLKKVSAFSMYSGLMKSLTENGILGKSMTMETELPENVTKILKDNNRKKEDLVKYVNDYHRRYTLFKDLKTNKLTLKWNRKEGKFEVLKAHKFEAPKDFKSFQKIVLEWQPLC